MSNETIPAWAQQLTAEPEPKRVHVATHQTDADRLADAKDRALDLCRESNPVGGPYGFEYHESYFQDFCGPETSTYACNHLLFMLYFLEDPKFRAVWFHEEGCYNSRAGIWSRDDLRISIQDLKNAVQNRIRELGISEILLVEYLAVPHGIAEGQQFNRLSFDEKMNRFRAA